MHTIYINNERARTPQEVADAVQSAPETVRIESGPEISDRDYDGPLLGLTRRPHVLFRTQDGVICEIGVNDRGGFTVGSFR